jgi:hypothetical protein
MNMEVQNSTVRCSGKGIFLVLTLAVSTLAETAALGAAQGSSRNELRAHVGRASLTVEDLKTLLGRKTRDPSSQAGAVKKDVTVPANPLKLTLDSHSVRKLARTLAELEMKRIQFEEQVTTDATNEIEKIRQERRKIQTSRISSTANRDPKLSRDLFDSFLSEANFKAKIEAALRQFDEQHMISIEFLEGADAKTIEAIYIGDQLAWSSSAAAREYARK